MIWDCPARAFRIQGLELTGWIPAGRDEGKTALEWITADSTPKDTRGLIMIDAARATKDSLEETAKALAAGWGGTLSNDKVLLDGELGIQNPRRQQHNFP